MWGEAYSPHKVSKIARMIGECDGGLHDPSRVGVSAAAVPRFNTPVESGIHLDPVPGARSRPAVSARPVTVS